MVVRYSMGRTTASHSADFMIPPNVLKAHTCPAPTLNRQPVDIRIRLPALDGMFFAASSCASSLTGGAPPAPRGWRAPLSTQRPRAPGRRGAWPRSAKWAFQPGDSGARDRGTGARASSSGYDRRCFEAVRPLNPGKQSRAAPGGSFPPLGHKSAPGSTLNSHAPRGSPFFHAFLVHAWILRAPLLPHYAAAAL